MKHRVQKSSLLAHETLPGPNLSHTLVQQPDIVFPKSREGNELSNNETVIEQCNSTEVSRFNTDNISNTDLPSTSKEVIVPKSLVRVNFQLNADKESYVTDRIERDRLQIFKMYTLYYYLYIYKYII